jgi:hypothetical protein
MTFDPTYRFTTSWIISPSVLFFQRLVFSLYGFLVIFFRYGWSASHNDGGSIGRSFSFFTELTWWGLTFYNLFAAIHTGSYWTRGRPFLDSWPRFLQEAHSVFYSTIVVYPILVTSEFDGACLCCSALRILI